MKIIANRAMLVAMNDVGDMGISDFEHCGYRRKCQPTGSHDEDFFNIGWRQSGRPMILAGWSFNAENFQCMSHVFGMRAVFQVGWVIVVFIAVSMVDFFAFWARSNEGKRHQSMDAKSSLLFVFVEGYDKISRPAFCLFQKPTTSLAEEFRDARQASYLTSIGDFIQAFIARHSAPFFDHLLTPAMSPHRMRFTG